MKLSLTGDWDATLKAIEGLEVHTKWAIRNGGKRVSKDFVDAVKAHIDNQDLGWQERSDRTLSSDPRILVDDELYYNSITFFEEGRNFYAGVKRGIVEPKSQTEVALIAMWHEMGLKNLPQRPLWNPTIQEFGGSTGIRDRIAIYIEKYLTNKNIPLNSHVLTKIRGSL